jgi:quinoprotein dehydrogenase-associated probable ABC transporter substrate-binding protein
MYSACKSAFSTLLLGAAALPCAAAPALRVCADPNRLPYSNRAGQGFENHLAELIASDLGMEVSYDWYPQREKFFKKTLDSGACDVVMGVPTGFAKAEETTPYYRSSYVFVSRRDRHLRIDSFDDPRLRELRIGVSVLGDSKDSTPPVYALASRGIARNVAAYSIFGASFDEANPSADLIRAVADGEVDVAIAWGPVAGYFARRSPVPLEIAAIVGDQEDPGLPLAFNIGIGVRTGDAALKQQLDAELTRRHAEIDRLLRSYGVPLLALATNQASLRER